MGGIYPRIRVGRGNVVPACVLDDDSRSFRRMVNRWNAARGGYQVRGQDVTYSDGDGRPLDGVGWKRSLVVTKSLTDRERRAPATKGYP